jgi:hypothetical protein
MVDAKGSWNVGSWAFHSLLIRVRVDSGAAPRAFVPLGHVALLLIPPSGGPLRARRVKLLSISLRSVVQNGYRRCCSPPLAPFGLPRAICLAPLGSPFCVKAALPSFAVHWLFAPVAKLAAFIDAPLQGSSQRFSVYLSTLSTLPPLVAACGRAELRWVFGRWSAVPEDTREGD